MQPRLRTLVWREMPPCVRRLGIAWSRRLLYAELFLGRLYLSLTHSPTWNFVALVGTLGIILTILLFLAPWEAESASVARSVRVSRASRSWELDSRLLAIDAPKNHAYPVELLAAGERRRSRTMTLTDLNEEPVQRRRSQFEEPLLPEFPEEPVLTSSRRRRWTELEEPVAEAAPPPKLGVDVNVHVPSDPFVADAVWTGRSEPPEIELSSRRLRQDWDDRWMLSDLDRIAREENLVSEEFDDLAVTASHADQPIGSAWEPVSFPSTAPSVADVELELTWNRRTTRRRPEPRLSVRNLSEETLDRIDVLPGPLPEFDFSAPSDVLTQSIAGLASQDEANVAMPRDGSRRSSLPSVVSVLVTTFVGGTTRVIDEPAEPVTKSVRSELPAPRRPARTREPDRPHLSLSVGKPGRLPREKIVTVPIDVVNDGNVPLSNVVILARIPATLEHEYGRYVHYRLGKLAPGEERRSTLFVTPLEAGSATIPLETVDGDRLASDAGAADIHLTDEEFAELKPRRSRLRADRSR